ncbi:hypothetical protein SDC9_105896 [bioreactor metagenome]|uniref:Uncharacterized protein n=1 Tax=bioreactor metagenome TaxID=1076179 RepID=A0A645B1X3_9ZZZZ
MGPEIPCVERGFSVAGDMEHVCIECGMIAQIGGDNHVTYDERFFRLIKARETIFWFFHVRTGCIGHAPCSLADEYWDLWQDLVTESDVVSVIVRNERCLEGRVAQEESVYRWSNGICLLQFGTGIQKDPCRTGRYFDD